MKLAFYIAHANFGGGEKMAFFLAQEFSARNIEVVVYSPDSLITKRSLPYKCVILEKKKGLPCKLSYFIRLFVSLKEERPDYILLFYNQDFVIGASLLTGTKMLSSLRTDYDFNAQGLFRKAYQRLWLNYSTKVVFQTEYVQRLAPMTIQEKSKVIYNPLMQNFPIQEGTHRRHRIISAGRLSKEKGFDLLIQSWAQVHNKMDYSLHIYGDGPEKKHLEMIIQQYGLQENVILEGYSHHIMEEMADAEIFVLNSSSEGFPNILLEAMSLGLACISTKFSSRASEILIGDNERGMLVEYGDVKQMTDCLSTLIINAQMRNNVQQKALEVRHLFNKDTIIGKWIQYIKL